MWAWHLKVEADEHTLEGAGFKAKFGSIHRLLIGY